MSKAKTPKFHPHVHLEKLINDKFGVIVDIRHTQFKTPVLNRRMLPIKARTTVKAYSSVEHLKEFPLSPLLEAASECSVEDTFVKSNGLTIALRRLYRDLAEIVKDPVEPALAEHTD